MCLCVWSGFDGANFVNTVNDSNKTGSSPVFFPTGLPQCLRAVLILHLLLNTLSLKEAWRPQFYKSELSYLWYLSPAACLSLMSSTSFVYLGLDDNDH